MISIASFARQSLLSILCCGALGVLGHVIINNPTKSNLSEPATFDFPQQVPLQDLPMLASKQLAIHTFKNGMVAKGRSYQYQHNPQPINVEVRYITDGEVNPPTLEYLIPVFTQIPATAIQPSTIKEQSGLGFYSLFVDQKTAYFGTCINPQGITTVTANQFHNNSNPNPLVNGIPVDRLFSWLLGRQKLRDSRCLWTVLSTPIDPAAPDATMKKLETLGVTWIHWWQSHFPPA